VGRSADFIGAEQLLSQRRQPVPDLVAAELERASRLPREPYFSNDPIHLVHRYEDAADREIVALVCALLAFGKVRAFLPKLESILRVLGMSPRSYVADYRPSRDAGFFRRFRSRIYTGDDLRLLFVHLQRTLVEHGTLEDAFLASQAAGHRERLEAFAHLFLRLDPAPVTGRKQYPRSYRHLVADPSRGSASKRWCLFLRWVARPDDGVDLGIWTRVDPADLVIPLDVHVGRISTLIGLRTRRTMDWKAAEEVTANLRAIDASDPVRFDFPLSHIGISARCRGRWAADICPSCAIASICRVGKRYLARRRAAP
jgi:uncharacterized protein (TIGR02757 family)